MARLEELERKFEENPRRYFAPLANEYRKAGDAQRAADLCRSQLPEVPGHISGHIVLGQALYDARDFDGSRAALETALALDPENIVALRYLGDIARDTGDAAEAERWYSRTLEADPYNEAATTALQVLRAAPAPAPAPASASPPSEPEPEPATASFAAGFEPTSHVEPEPVAESTASVDETAPETFAREEAVAPVEEAVAPVEEAVEPQTESQAEPAEEPSREPSAVEEAVAPAEETTEPATEFQAEPVEQLSAEAPAVMESPVPAEIESPASGVLTVTGEFAGDLSVSTEPEASEPEASEPTSAEASAAADEPAIVEASAEADSSAPAADEPSVAAVAAEASTEEASPAEETMESPAEQPSPAPEAIHVSSEASAIAEPEVERFDVAAHAPSEQETHEEVMQTEERVLESAAPFVTETMADLYLEQGYPHEALELLLQLSEQRPHDEQLRGKLEHIESIIVARRDAAVAAARAERAETAEAAAEAERQDDAVEAAPELHHLEDAVAIAPEPEPEPEPQPEPEPEPQPVPEPESPISVRELFARMDRARPRSASAVTPRPISRRRSDFVPLPESESAVSDGPDDPFAFPNAPAPAPVPRTSGPHPTFNPSTADPDDFNAWLRGLKGP